MSKEKMKSKASVFAIRMQLLWIWFLKNITVFLRLAVFVLIILILFGVVKFGDDGIIDTIFYDVFRNWDEAKVNGFKTVENVIAAILSLGISVLMVMRKTRSITVKDIKSRKLKIAMLKANLYFNENGKLCRKLEEATKMDINGDGKVGDTDLNEIPEEITAVGVVRAAGELATILTTPIDVNAGEDKVLEDEELSQQVEDEDESVVIAEKLYTEEDGAPESIEIEEENEESEDDQYDMDKELDKPFFLVRFFQNILKALKLSKTPKVKKEKKEKHKKEKKTIVSEDNDEEKQTIEVVDTNETPELFRNEETQNVSANTEVKNEVVEEAKPEQPVVKPAEPKPVPKPQPAKSKQIDDILNSLK